MDDTHPTEKYGSSNVQEDTSVLSRVINEKHRGLLETER